MTRFWAVERLPLLEMDQKIFFHIIFLVFLGDLGATRVGRLCHKEEEPVLLNNCKADRALATTLLTTRDTDMTQQQAFTVLNH